MERLRLLLTTAGGIKRFAACIKMPRLLEAAMLQCCLGALDNCMRIEIYYVSICECFSYCNIMSLDAML